MARGSSELAALPRNESAQMRLSPDVLIHGRALKLSTICNLFEWMSARVCVCVRAHPILWQSALSSPTIAVHYGN